MKKKTSHLQLTTAKKCLHMLRNLRTTTKIKWMSHRHRPTIRASAKKSDPDWETLENNAENEDSSENEEPSATKGGAESHEVLSYCKTRI